MLKKTEQKNKEVISTIYLELLSCIENIFEKIKKELISKKENHSNLKVWEAENQHQIHGFAWIATYIEALRQINNWSTQLTKKNKIGDFEYLIIEIAFREYIGQLINGIPMSQTEFIKFKDYDSITN